MAKAEPVRTLVRVLSVDSDLVGLVIPGWNPHYTIWRRTDDFPRELRPLLAVGKRFHARVNMNAQIPEEIQLRDCETNGE